MRTTLAGIVLVAATAAWATDGEDVKGRTASAATAFTKLKSLSGDWLQIDGDEQTLVSKIRVVAGGSAVMETTFPDTDMEMISMYHLDGERLVMTHYCVAGNQPRFRGVLKGSTLTLNFDGGSNIKDGDMHIHAGVIEFVDDNHIRSKWTPWEDGKPGEPHAFELTRANAAGKKTAETRKASGGCVCASTSASE